MFEQVTLDEITQWMQSYGVLIVFIALALENVLFLSMVVPGLFVLVAAGFLAAGGTISIVEVLVVGVAAVWIGDLMSFAIGRYLWNPLFQRNARLNRWMDNARLILESRGNFIFVIYHFEPFTRMIGAAAVGTSRVPILRWLPFDFLGAALWVIFYGGVGYALGWQSRDLDDWQSMGPIPVVALVVILTWTILVGRSMRRMINVSRS